MNSQCSFHRLWTDAETVAHDIAIGHKRHVGFCYRELKEIARSFAYWPPVMGWS